MAKKCYLKSTSITLCDGQQYTFRELPFTARVMELVKQNPVPYRELVSVSLGYDYSADTINDLFEFGAIPSLSHADLWERIMDALIPQSNKPADECADERGA